MNKLALVFLFAALSLTGGLSSADTPGTEKKIVLNIGVSKTPSALPVLRMLEARALGDAAELRITVWVAPEQLLAMAQDPNYQMYTLPLTLAAKLRNKGVPVQLTNVNTWGGISLITSDPQLRDWTDLKGGTLYIPQRASPPDALTQYFLGRAGLKADRDVTLVHSAIAEIAQLLKAGRISSAVLIEPQATAAKMGDPSLRTMVDFEAAWRKIQGEGASLPSLGFGGNEKFLKANPDLIRRFEAAYREAVDWVLANPAGAGALAEKHLGLSAAVIEDAMPTLGLRYRSALEAAPDLEKYFRVLYDFSPPLIGDRIPDETLYWR